MRIGFTGTREGMTSQQKDGLYSLLVLLPPDEFHHGDCIGADVDSCGVLDALGVYVWVVVHPPENPALRAFMGGQDIRDPKGYIERDHDIVDETEVLIAAPRSDVEEARSGTWATVRYARTTGKPRFLIFPDGTVKFEGGAGVREPRGDSPDSPPAGVDGVPGPGGEPVAIGYNPDDPRDLRENIIPLSPEEFVRDTRVDWPVIPARYEYISLSPAYVSLDCINFYEVPEGTSLSEFVAELAGK